MALTERDRHDAYEALQDTFGQQTDNVIAMMREADNLATKDDIRELRDDLGVFATKDDLAELRADLTAFATKQELTAFATKEDLSAGLAVTEARLRTEMANLQVAMEHRMTELFQHQTRTFIFTIMGAVVLLMLAEALRSVVG